MPALVLSEFPVAEIELYSAALCPFAHRTRLALAEKGIRANVIEIDLENKPAGFLKISPYGKVPVLKHGTRRVWESASINEYLDEAFPNPPLLPDEPAWRANARMWIHFADSRLFAATARLLHSGDPQLRMLALNEVIADLRFIEHEALAEAADDGPYWLGRDFSLVDLTFYPWFEQLVVLERFRGFRMPAFTRIRKWRDAVSRRDTVRSIAASPEFYVEHYARLFQREGLSL